MVVNFLPLKFFLYISGKVFWIFAVIIFSLILKEIEMNAKKLLLS